MLFLLNRRFLRLLFFSFFMAAMLRACATVQSKPADTAATNHQIISEKIKQGQKIFLEQNPMMATRMGALEMITRMATPADVPEDTYKVVLGFPEIGAGSLALGLVAVPMFASALVVGGALLIPLGTYIFPAGSFRPGRTKPSCRYSIKSFPGMHL